MAIKIMAASRIYFVIIKFENYNDQNIGQIGIQENKTWHESITKQKFLIISVQHSIDIHVLSV